LISYHNTEDLDLNLYNCENLKFRIRRKLNVRNTITEIEHYQSNWRLKTYNWGEDILDAQRTDGETKNINRFEEQTTKPDGGINYITIRHVFKLETVFEHSSMVLSTLPLSTIRFSSYELPAKIYIPFLM
jgi:hypothetical protein